MGILSDIESPIETLKYHWYLHLHFLLLYHVHDGVTMYQWYFERAQWNFCWAKFHWDSVPLELKVPLEPYKVPLELLSVKSPTGTYVISTSGVPQLGAIVEIVRTERFGFSWRHQNFTIHVWSLSAARRFRDGHHVLQTGAQNFYLYWSS